MILFGSKKSPEVKFWEWFVAHEDKLFNQLEPRNELWIALMKRMKQVHAALVFEVGVQLEADGRRQFVISADGIREAFQSVEQLADAAPPLERWNVIRFRPPIPAYAENVLQMHGREIAGDSIECALARNEVGTIDVLMRIPGCPNLKDHNFTHIGFIFLDMALGEYDVECSVGDFTVVPIDFEINEACLIPYADLRELFYRLRDEE